MTVESGESGTCTSCGGRVLPTDWQEHRERIHGYRPEHISPPGVTAHG
jgi:hypothetical protein